jgi:transglutaminase-like putative cysteine protease
MPSKVFFAMILLVMSSPPSPSTGAEGIRVSLPYQAARSKPVRYDVDFAVIVTAPYKTTILKVWLPMPQSDAAQTVVECSLSTEPMGVVPRVSREPVFGNQFAYFEFHEPQGAQIIRHKFRVTAWQLDWNMDPDKVEQPHVWPAEFETYLRSETQAIVVNDQLREVLNSIVPKRQRSFHDLRRALEWADAHLTYDHVNASLQASSVHALTQRAGHCSDYHGLCAAFGRELGFPMRVTYGINPFPKNSPSHCKLEAFLPPYGWVSFDVSETQKMVTEIRGNAALSPAQRDELSAAARRRLLAGFRDNTWFLQTKGSDYELSPPAAKRVAVVRTAYVEADGVALPEPDPGAKGQTNFSWMTAHEYVPDRTIAYPFRDWTTLETD